MNIIWSEIAFDSYYNEIDFILKKWNNTQVEKFILAVKKFEELVLLNPNLGKKYKNKDLKSFVISKQSTIIYKIEHKKNIIKIILIWNNSRNPKELIKTLNL